LEHWSKPHYFNALTFAPLVARTRANWAPCTTILGLILDNRLTYGGALERSRSKSPYRCHTPKCVIGDRQAIRLVPTCSHFLQPCFPESDVVGLAQNGYAEVLFLAKRSIDFARVDCACCCRGSPEPATGAPSGLAVANQTPHTQLSLPALADFEAVLRSRSRFRPNPIGTTTFLGGRLAIESSLAHRSRLGDSANSSDALFSVRGLPPGQKSQCRDQQGSCPARPWKRTRTR
jgi:hypothetical protein